MDDSRVCRLRIPRATACACFGIFPQLLTVPSQPGTRVSLVKWKYVLGETQEILVVLRFRRDNMARERSSPPCGNVLEHGILHFSGAELSFIE